MAHGDSNEAVYMARRTLGILLGDARPNPAKSVSTEFRPESGHSLESPPLPLSVLVHLLNSWVSVRGLFQGVLPSFKFSKTFEKRLRKDAVVGGRGSVDWQATLRSRRHGGNATFARSNQRARDIESEAYVAFVLVELRTHLQALVQHLERLEKGYAGAVGDILQDLSSAAGELENMLSDASLNEQVSSELVAQVQEKFEEELAAVSPKELFGLYTDWGVEALPRAPSTQGNGDFVRRLSRWRSQYLSGDVWLSNEKAFEVQYGRLDGLYELWCFAELLSAAQSLGVPELSQNCFLKRGNVDPQFDLSEKYYAYFDFRSRNFQSVRGNSFQMPKSNDRPTLDGAHVEWFLENVEDYRQSIVFDTKYYKKWSNGEALKVLGYMMNFGVRNGAIVFAGEIGHLSKQIEPVASGLYKLPCPTEEPATLWVLQLIPEQSAAAATRHTLCQFLEQTLTLSE